ncbi:MAG: DUF5011 domain-containing protein [Firmicutes bacterium]|jgi:peptidoglycan/xylan/chitin deacetylase (PgdA/CDA1 family)|nr:DUF5011 domain-containing protein [Bacillota bacterium]
MSKYRNFKITAVIAAAFTLIFTMAGCSTTLKLNGESEVIVNVGQTYEDEGTNVDKAQALGEVDTSKEGDYTVKYTYKEQEVERIVHVVNPDNLVVGLRGSEKTIVKQGDPYIESGAFGIDKNSGVLDDFEISGQVDTETPGEYGIIYTFKSGYIKKEIVRQVEVVAKDEFKANTDGIPVMMYHYVYTESNKPEKLNSNYISDKKLEEQLKYLKNEGYYFPSFRELRAYADGKISLPQKSVILTFDDGQKGFLNYGVSLLNKYKVPATSFLIGIKDGESKIKTYASPYVAFESHSYNMHRAGGNIGHGGVISALSKEQIVEDLKQQIDMVESDNAFAYPYGDVTEDAKEAVAEAEIQCAFTTAYGKVHVGDDYREFSRVRVHGTNSLDSYIAGL